MWATGRGYLDSLVWQMSEVGEIEDYLAVKKCIKVDKLGEAVGSETKLAGLSLASAHS